MALRGSRKNKGAAGVDRTRKPKMVGGPNQPIVDRVAVVGINDRWSTYPSKGLTPQKLAALLREADAGDVYRQMELFEEMLEKDGHLQALFQARRLAVLRRNYNIIPASDKPEDVKLADDVDKMIKKIRGWRGVLADILDCVPKGFSVNEIYWAAEGGLFSPRTFDQVHQKKFRFGKPTDAYSDPKELRMLVDPKQVELLRGIVPDVDLTGATVDGISLSVDPRIRRRFIVAFCKARSGNPSRTSLLRTLTYLFLFKNYDVKWWVQFAEIVLGFRIGKYDAGQSDQKALLEEALKGLATDSMAVISKDAEIEFKTLLEKANAHRVYSELKDWINEEASEVVLGHTGTTQGTPGKMGQEDMAKEVKQELVEADAMVMDDAVNDDFIVPYVDYNHGSRDEYPYYQTDLSKSLDLLEEARIDRELQAMGFPISKKYVKEKYGRPLPNLDDEEDEVLTPVSTTPLIPAKAVLADGKKKLLRRR